MSMEVVEKNIGIVTDLKGDHDHEDDDIPLPGFRFHPTDEELVGFYLRRKVEKRPISIELIKQIDIYKYDPWDLPKGSTVGDNEWYFFCKRGRKYRNSIRPNRVTGSGFWKATGIDRPIYATEGEARNCIGLKKSLVYYRGSAGKGTKTDWMMHEFRLPADQDNNTKHHKDTKNNINAQEAEVWTLCRILKRNVSNRKGIPDWREMSAKRSSNNTNNSTVIDACSKTCSVESNKCEGYISFTTPAANEKKSSFFSNANSTNQQFNQLFIGQRSSISDQVSSNITSSYPNSFPINPDVNEFLLKHEDWDELRSVVELAADPYFIL